MLEEKSCNLNLPIIPAVCWLRPFILPPGTRKHFRYMAMVYEKSHYGNVYSHKCRLGASPDFLLFLPACFRATLMNADQTLQTQRGKHAGALQKYRPLPLR